MLTERDMLLEQHLIAASKKPKNNPLDETITRFDRDIFMYNKDSVHRQTEPSKTTYEDHRKAIETAVNIFNKETTHDIAMCILTHRYFENYRNSVFSGKGSFNNDYSFLLKKISALFNKSTGTVIISNIPSQLREYKTPTLVQLNHIAGEVTEVKLPVDSTITLTEWAQRYNAGCHESTTYMVVGLSLAS